MPNPPEQAAASRDPHLTLRRVERQQHLVERLARSGVRWTVQQLADDLGVSTRTVARDVQRLRDSGVPVVVSTGRQGGVQLNAVPHPAPVMLDHAQLATLIASLAALGPTTGEPARSAMLTLVEALSGASTVADTTTPPPKGRTMPSAVTLIRSSALSDAAEYAYAATAPSNARLIFLAGSCPLNEDGSTHGVGDVAAQAAKCVENMTIALSEAGATLEDVISTRVLVASSAQDVLVAAWEVVRDAFGEHDVPSTLLGVTVLGYDDQLVEIEATAATLD